MKSPQTATAFTALTKPSACATWTCPAIAFWLPTLKKLGRDGEAFEALMAR